MNHLKQTTNQLSKLMFLYLLGANLLMVSIFLLTWWVLELALVWVFLSCVVAAFLLAFVVARSFAAYFTEPLDAIWRAVLHVSKNSYDVMPPDLDKVVIGHDLVDSLCRQVYDLASSAMSEPVAQTGGNAASVGTLAYDILGKFSLPVIVLGHQREVVYVNEAAVAYAGMENPIGKQYNTVINLKFPNTDPFDGWIDNALNNRLTDTHHWEHIELPANSSSESSSATSRFCDASAYFNKDNPLGYETVLTLFDKTDAYSVEDNNFDYVALAVHELRTPLTMMRGYIEVLKEEAGPLLTAELKDFMQKLDVSAQQLQIFISNILNMARIEEGQFQPKLQKEDWNVLLPQICGELELRATLRGMKMEYDIQPNLPAVAVDRVSIYEALANLIDNAIKYSPVSSRIIIHAKLGKDGDVETSVQDFGIGMPDNVIKHLFTKFYRNHRSKSQITGSGIGLYLVKTFITAQGGDVWATSKEGEGSTFGFRLKSYDSLAEEQKVAGEHPTITPHAHGWIKNHSLYRG